MKINKIINLTNNLKNRQEWITIKKENKKNNINFKEILNKEIEKIKGGM